jgi:hypothetical protein
VPGQKAKRQRVLEQIERLTQLASREKDATLRGALVRLKAFYEAKLAFRAQAPSLAVALLAGHSGAAQCDSTHRPKMGLALMRPDHQAHLPRFG